MTRNQCANCLKLARLVKSVRKTEQKSENDTERLLPPFSNITSVPKLAYNALSPIEYNSGAFANSNLRIATVLKEIPRNSLNLLELPNLGYNFFESRQDHPFDYDAREFNLTNAWWLAEASYLAFGEAEFVTTRFQNAGLPNVRYFAGPSTDCYVAHNDRFAIVVFRGSELWKRPGSTDRRNVIADWLADFDVLPVASDHGGQVHRGFKNALDEIWDQSEDSLKKYLDKLREDLGLKVWFTGHSLGGALATVATQRYQHVPALYSFGAPRVGDSEFCESVKVPVFRFVHKDDIVPRVPPSGLFRHVGTLKYIDSNNEIQTDASVWERAVSSFRYRYGAFFDSLGKLKSGADLEIPVNCFTDHAPVYYVVHIWNNCVRQENR
jgi:hypothetical protein